MNLIDHSKVTKRISLRLTMNILLNGLFLFATIFGLLVLAILLYRIFTQGIGFLDIDFLTNFASRIPERAGVVAALVGSIWLMVVVAPISLLLGVGTALYLEEYAQKNKLTQLIQINISNLAGVPSIVFGLLGLAIFVHALAFGTSILAASLTMSLLILPVIIVASQEAIRAVPKELREASYGMGATKWQTIVKVVLPAAIPGILTGGILALSRAVGETAPLIVIGIPTFVPFLPSSILDSFTALPIQIYDWTSRPQTDFHDLAAAGIIVLLIFLILMNSIAVWIRNKFEKRY
ncbi:MAG TPA: phosphate ABC transporter permease PstA [Bacillus sp. (in: firmicutes)]|uniref:phosphate ABC transporter permease PstA n=1 Tax=Bacillus litorisediminis TaxID=2922713 RepID=UPI001FAF8763|nr:phosphate ABC transporter permease PstA [Bacillus litorisediminis]HWO77645.1 phosphate ABC transporter permease PstA [Bacillus sp. (in: firmicutes)]